MRMGKLIGPAAGVAAALVCLTGCESSLTRLLDVKTISPGELNRRRQEKSPLLILDFTDPADFKKGHIPGSVSATVEQVRGWFERGEFPRHLPVVTVCPQGIRSIYAAKVVREHGVHRVRSLAGGTRGWKKAGHAMTAGAGERISTRRDPPRARSISLFHQVISVLTGLVIKPIHMLLTFLLIVFLARRRSQDLRIVRLGLSAFLVGESVCAVNFLTAGGSSEFLDTIHGLGMVAMGVLVPWGLYCIADERMIRFSAEDKRCALHRFCGECWKRQDVPCGLHRVFLFAAPFVMLVCLIPSGTSLHSLHEVNRVFSSDVIFSYSLQQQLIDFRLYPLLAALLMAGVTVQLARGVRHMKSVQIPFFLAMGLAAYSLFRFMLLEGFRRAPLWADFWEELTELGAVSILAWFLYVFREPLGLRRNKSTKKA